VWDEVPKNACPHEEKVWFLHSCFNYDGVSAAFATNFSACFADLPYQNVGPVLVLSRSTLIEALATLRPHEYSEAQGIEFSMKLR